MCATIAHPRARYQSLVSISQSVHDDPNGAYPSPDDRRFTTCSNPITPGLIVSFIVIGIFRVVGPGYALLDTRIPNGEFIHHTCRDVRPLFYQVVGLGRVTDDVV